MAASGPPAYAWDWFARQRLLWREVRSRLASGAGGTSTRYAALEDRSEVISLVRADYPHDDGVRRTVDAVVAEVAFLGRTDRPFAALGVRTAPRGMRWWWTALTGEDLDRPPPRGAPSASPGPRTGAAASRTGMPDAGAPAPAAQQLSLVDLAEVDPEHALDDVAGGYGDTRR